MLLDMPSQESPLSIRQNSNQVLKQAIGRYASSLVENGDTIVLDASSTAMEMIPFLGDFHDLTIITNGLLTAVLHRRPPAPEQRLFPDRPSG